MSLRKVSRLRWGRYAGCHKGKGPLCKPALYCPCQACTAMPRGFPGHTRRFSIPENCRKQPSFGDELVTSFLMIVVRAIARPMSSPKR